MKHWLAMAESKVTVRNLAGNVVAEIYPAPATVADLKVSLLDTSNVPLAMQRLMLGDTPLEDTHAFGAEGATELTFVVDESAHFTWDIHVESNPASALLRGSGGTVRYVDDRYDYVNVLTQEPVQGGFHYFEFVMHKVGDEQWCGVTPHKERAGHRGEFAGGWFYYSGRRYCSTGELHAGHERHNVKSVNHVKDGDVIGVLLDLEEGIVAFTLNGIVQGACATAQCPLYLSTSLDAADDEVELRKPPVQEAPLSLVEVRALPLSGGSEPAYTGWESRNRSSMMQMLEDSDSDYAEDSD